MEINKIKEYLAQDWLAVTGMISSSLQSDIELLNKTNDAILSSAGKQIRPMMAVLFARACSGGRITEASVRYATAAELLHNATLLHDDVADNSDKRRGVPTIRSLMGPSVSVLVGDYWLVKAMEMILGGGKGDVEAIRIFSKTLSDLAEGEMLQLQKAQGADTSLEDYMRIIYSKTASLFEATCMAAALSVSSSDIITDAVRSYAVAIGLAFQIKDDILDYAGTESVGKPLGVDLLEQKITIPLIGAMQNAGERESILIRNKVRGIVEHPEYREEIVEFVRINKGLEYAETILIKHIEEAVKSLDVLPDSYEKDCLKELAFYVSRRSS